MESNRVGPLLALCLGSLHVNPEVPLTFWTSLTHSEESLATLTDEFGRPITFSVKVSKRHAESRLEGVFIMEGLKTFSSVVFGYVFQ